MKSNNKGTLRIRFRSIFARLVVTQCGTLLLLVLIVGLACVLVVRSQNMQEKRDLLMEKAAQVKLSLEDGSATADGVKTVADEHDILIQTVTNIEVKSYYIDEKWTPVSATSRTDTAYESVSRRANNIGASTTSYFKTDLGFPILTTYITFSQPEKSGVLLLHFDMTVVNRHSTQVAIWIMAITILGVLAAVFVAYYTSYRIINPFVKMNETVQSYSKGDFSQRVNVVGRDEAAQLGRSFNEMAEQLKDLEESRRSFVANVSHELRSPLTSMKGFLEAMYDGTIDKEDQPHYIELVLDETRRLTTMVNDLLDLARIESGTIVLHYEVFDINELIRRTLITFEARIVEKKLDLDVRFAQEQSFVNADQNQIAQVLRNLIDNAIKYSPEESMLGVATYAMRKQVYISVRDTGIGIPQEDVGHVFDRFYKVEKAHTPSPTVGSGLGLSIVKRIIDQHDQSITVRSAKGRGTQFTFTLERAANPIKRQSPDGGK